jgi:hypothetical protein
MGSFCTVDLRERTCVDRSSTSGVITLGESECGEVETPEARRAEVVCSRRSVGDTRRQIIDFGCKHSGRKWSVGRLKLSKPRRRRVWGRAEEDLSRPS